MGNGKERKTAIATGLTTGLTAGPVLALRRMLGRWLAGAEEATGVRNGMGRRETNLE